MKVWRISDKSFEQYKGWELYTESTRTYGLTIGIEDTRIKVIKNFEEMVIVYDKNQREIRNIIEAIRYIKKQIDILEEHRIWIFNG